MIKIKPITVGYPAQEANAISIRVMPFQTNDRTCSTYYQLKNVSVITDEEGVETEIVKDLAEGNCQLSEQQFEDWGSDNTYIEDVVLEILNLER